MSRANVGSARSDGAGKTPRHVSLSPRSSSRAELSSASNPHSHSSLTAAGGEGGGEGGGELIITRGLKEILAKDMELRKSEERRGSSSLGKSPSLSRKGVAPNFITCYLCGQQFGSASIGIHQPQCYLKTLIAWERNDPALRGPKPLDPETHEKRIAERMAQGNTSSGTTARPLSPSAAATGASKSTTMKTKASETRHQDVYNELQFEAFKKSLAPCPNCGRTFLPDRLVVHLRSCKVVAEANKPARTVGKPGAASHKPSSATRNAAAVTAATASVVAEPQRVDGAAMHKSQRKSTSLSALAEPSPRPPLDLAGTAQTSVNTKAADDKAGIVADDHDNVVMVKATVSRKTSIEKTEEERVVHKAESSHESPARERAQEKTHTAAITAAAEGESTTPRRSPRPRQPSLPTHDEESTTQESTVAAVQPLQHPHIERVHEEAEGQAALSSRSLSETAEARSTPPLLLATQPGNSSSNNNNNNEEEEEGEGANANSKENEEGEDETAQPAFGEPGQVLTRRIKLNNVSHFKQVPSRLRQQLRQQKATLVPCRYCGRHFMPTRLSTHEEVCVGRDHGPAGIHLSGSTHAHTNTTPINTTAAAAGSYRSNSGSKPGRSLTSLSMSENSNIINSGGAVVASPTMALAQRAGNENGSAKRRNSLTAGKDADTRDSAERANNVTNTTTVPAAAVSAKPALRRSSAETRPQPRRSSGKPEAVSAPAASVGSAEPTPQPAAAAAAAGETVPHFCGQCGTKLMSATQRFCIACGARIISA